VRAGDGDESLGCDFEGADWPDGLVGSILIVVGTISVMTVSSETVGLTGAA
jgi:hypothetical protein